MSKGMIDMRKGQDLYEQGHDLYEEGASPSNANFLEKRRMSLSGADVNSLHIFPSLTR